jgi:hypothetical protein
MHVYRSFQAYNTGAAGSAVGSWMKAFVCRRSRPIDEARDEVYRAPSARHEIEYRPPLFSTIHNLCNCEITCISINRESFLSTAMV